MADAEGEIHVPSPRPPTSITDRDGTALAVLAVAGTVVVVPARPTPTPGRTDPRAPCSSAGPCSRSRPTPAGHRRARSTPGPTNGLSFPLPAQFAAGISAIVPGRRAGEILAKAGQRVRRQGQPATS